MINYIFFIDFMCEIHISFRKVLNAIDSYHRNSLSLYIMT